MTVSARERGSMHVDPPQPWQPQLGPINLSESGHPGADAGVRITVVVAIELDLLRSALASLLSGEDDFEVVAAVRRDDSLAVALRMHPDVVLIEGDQDSRCALSIVGRLRARLPQTQIVALVAAKPAGLVQRLLTADVLGFVDRNARLRGWSRPSGRRRKGSASWTSPWP